MIQTLGLLFKNVSTLNQFDTYMMATIVPCGLTAVILFFSSGISYLKIFNKI